MAHLKKQKQKKQFLIVNSLYDWSQVTGCSTLGRSVASNTSGRTFKSNSLVFIMFHFIVKTANHLK